MAYYRLECDLKYRTLCWDGELPPTTDRLEFDFVRQFWADQPIQPWRPPPIRFRTLDEEIELEEDTALGEQHFRNGASDCPFYSAALLIFSARAYDGLHDLFRGAGQFLPIPVADPECTLYAFNCTRVLDALDRTSSIIDYDEEDTPPRPREIKRFVFDPQVVGDCNVFRMHWPPPFAVYVSDTVVDRINRLKLTGFLAGKLTD
jgi:hypothetical protein